jgi:4-amino-4-deoxychorismate lyase
MTIAVLIDGKPPHDLSHALALNDRGFHYGDGLFETALLDQGTVRFLDAHLDRLYAGCVRLAIQAPEREQLRADIASVTANLRSAVLKIILSRGVGARGYRPNGACTTTRVVALYPAPQAHAASMLKLRWCETRLGRNARLAGIKHLNRLEQVLAQAEWDDPDTHEGLMLDTEGELVCGTACNVFIVRDGALLTPDLRFCGVRGVMRGQVLRAARELGFSISEEPLWPQDVEAAHEVFVTNAVRGIRSVGSLGTRRWAQSTIADALKAALRC